MSKKRFANEIDEQEKMLLNVRKYIMTEDTNLEDFKAIKSDCTAASKTHEAKLADLPNRAKGVITIDAILEIVIQKFSNMQTHYKSVSKV